jgi:hypothetical protein
VQVRVGLNADAPAVPGDAHLPCGTTPLRVSLDGVTPSSNGTDGSSSDNAAQPNPLLAVSLTVVVPPANDTDLVALGGAAAALAQLTERLLQNLGVISAWTDTALSVYGLTDRAASLLAGLVTPVGQLGDLAPFETLPAIVNGSEGSQQSLDALAAIRNAIVARGMLQVPQGELAFQFEALEGLVNASQAKLEAFTNQTRDLVLGANATLEFVLQSTSNLSESVNHTQDIFREVNASLVAARKRVDSHNSQSWPKWLPNPVIAVVIWGVVAVVAFVLGGFDG